MTQERRTSLCDFCGIPHPIWVFPTEPFILRWRQLIMADITNAWHACGKCSGAILQADWPCLRRSMLARHLPAMKHTRMTPDNVCEFVDTTIAEFRKHQLGRGHAVEGGVTQ